MAERLDLDDLEADLGPETARRVVDAIGGQTRHVPKPEWANRSTLARMIGPVAARWIADRFGGEAVSFPSRTAQLSRNRSARLMADVLDAGLDDPTRSANEIAHAHGVTARRVQQIRQQLRDERANHNPKSKTPLPR